jgi:hypothetical protein
MKFLDLVTHIAEVDDVARMSAGRLVQQALSLRNWIIGAGVVEFEQSGEDRACLRRAVAPTTRRCPDGYRLQGVVRSESQELSASSARVCRTRWLRSGTQIRSFPSRPAIWDSADVCRITGFTVSELGTAGRRTHASTVAGLGLADEAFYRANVFPSAGAVAHRRTVAAWFLRALLPERTMVGPEPTTPTRQPLVRAHRPE